MMITIQKKWREIAAAQAAVKPVTIDDLRPNTHFKPIAEVFPNDSGPELKKVLTNHKGDAGDEKKATSTGTTDAGKTSDEKKETPEGVKDDMKAGAKVDVTSGTATDAKADVKADVKAVEPTSDTGTASLKNLLAAAKKDEASLIQDGRPGIMRKESQFPHHNLADLAKTPEEKDIMSAESPLAAAFSKRYGIGKFKSTAQAPSATSQGNQAPQNHALPTVHPLWTSGFSSHQPAQPPQALHNLQEKLDKLDGRRTVMAKGSRASDLEDSEAGDLEEAKRLLSQGHHHDLTPHQLELIKRAQNGHKFPSHQAPSPSGGVPSPSLIRHSGGVPSPSPLDG